MKHEIKITFENNFVQIISDGEKSYETSSKVWPKIIKVCQENDCFKVLGIATSTKSPSIIDTTHHGKLFHELEIDHKYKIAWVELNPESFERIKFLETVLYNRGLPGKLFSDIEEAKIWLLKDE